MQIVYPALSLPGLPGLPGLPLHETFLRPPFPDLFQSLIVNTRDSIAAGTSWNHSSAQKMYEQIMNKLWTNARRY